MRITNHKTANKRIVWDCQPRRFALRSPAPHAIRYVFQLNALGIYEARRIVKRSTKAVLLSAFLFPGVGHLYLKKFVTGILLFFGAAFATYFIASNAVNKAFEITEKIQSEGLLVDIDAIGLLVSEQSRGAEGSLLSLATIALIAFWIIGIADSYRRGRIEERVDEALDFKKT